MDKYCGHCGATMQIIKSGIPRRVGYDTTTGKPRYYPNPDRWRCPHWECDKGGKIALFLYIVVAIFALPMGIPMPYALLLWLTSRNVANPPAPLFWWLFALSLFILCIGIIFNIRYERCGWNKHARRQEFSDG